MLAAACGGGGGGNGGDGGGGGGNGDGTVDGTMLPDDGPCTPGAQRCNVNTPETCGSDGMHWVPGTACTTSCVEGACTLAGLDVTSDMTLEGVVPVTGAVTVHSGATLSSVTGRLTIIADSITVENGGSISVAATGSDAAAAGFAANESSEQAGGGRNLGISTNSDILPGGPGGKVINGGTIYPGAAGGGVLRLIAKTSITMAGQLTADGANGIPATVECFLGTGGGAGGGILLVADSLNVTGSLSASGGLGGPEVADCGTSTSQPGGLGFVKMLYGSTNTTTAAIVTGTKVNAIAPPLPVKSTSHPDPTATYNDGFVSLDMSWDKAFPSALGYYIILDRNPNTVPTASNGMFVGATTVSFPSSMVSDGDNYVHIVSQDGQSAISTVATTFHVAINTEPPSMESSSHPDPDMFLPNTNPFFMWTYPQGTAQVSAAYYVFDHFGDTVPAITDTKLPATQLQLQQTNVAAGVWVLHVVAADSQGRLTKVAGNYHVSIGNNPGLGFVGGAIVNASQQPVSGAIVSINRGLYSTTTASNGTYNALQVPAGTWELDAGSGALSGSKMISVGSGSNVTGNLTIQ